MTWRSRRGRNPWTQRGFDEWWLDDLEKGRKVADVEGFELCLDVEELVKEVT